MLTKFFSKRNKRKAVERAAKEMESISDDFSTLITGNTLYVFSLMHKMVLFKIKLNVMSGIKVYNKPLSTYEEKEKVIEVFNKYK